MKKSKKILSIVMATLLTVSIGASVKVSAATDSIVIPDEELKVALLETVNKNQGEELTKKDLQSIKKLDVYGKNIKSLNGIENCTSLTELEIGDNEVKDLTPLKSLKGLTDFRAENCELTDISALSCLPNLEYISLDYNCIYDIKPLLGLKNVKYVSILEQIINLDQISTTGSVKVNYPIVDGVKNGDIRIYDISDNGKYNSSKHQIEWKNVKSDTTLNFFFKEHFNINGEAVGRIAGIVNVPTKVK